MDEFINFRDPGRERLCSWDWGASLFSSIGSYAAEAASSIGEWASGLSAAEIAQYGATALNVAGQAVQTAGAVGQAEEQARLGEAQAKIIETETEYARRAERQQNRRLLARNRAVAGASGVDPFSGSPLELELANAFEGRMNEELIGYGGGLRARNARLGASYSRNAIPGMIAGGALKAGSSVLGDWYYANQGTSTRPRSTVNRYKTSSWNP